MMLHAAAYGPGAPGLPPPYWALAGGGGSWGCPPPPWALPPPHPSARRFSAPDAATDTAHPAHYAPPRQHHQPPPLWLQPRQSSIPVADHPFAPSPGNPYALECAPQQHQQQPWPAFHLQVPPPPPPPLPPAARASHLGRQAPSPLHTNTCTVRVPAHFEERLSFERAMPFLAHV